MRFWDASAIVPLLVAEPPSHRLRAVLAADPAMSVWWVTQIECVSALVRQERDGNLDPQATTVAFERLREFTEGWVEIDPSDVMREVAARFLRVHPLRAADSLQLAAAFVAAEHRPASLTFVTLDQRLANAARKEGFGVIDLAAE